MGEGPECHVPKVIVRFKPIPARILKFSRRTHTHTHTHQSECSSQQHGGPQHQYRQKDDVFGTSCTKKACFVSRR